MLAFQVLTLQSTSFVAWETPLNHSEALECSGLSNEEMVSSTLGHCCKGYTCVNVFYLTVLHTHKSRRLIAHVIYRRLCAFKNVKLSELPKTSQKQGMYFYRKSY